MSTVRRHPLSCSRWRPDFRASWRSVRAETSSRSSRQERPLRHDAPRPAGRSGSSPASRPRTRSRSTGCSSPRSTCRSGGRGSPSGSAQIAVASLTALVVFAIGTRLRSPEIGARRRAPDDAAPVRRLARRPPQPGDARRARRWRRSCSSRSRRRTRPIAPARGRCARRRRRGRDPRQRAACPPPRRARDSTLAGARGFATPSPQRRSSSGWPRSWSRRGSRATSVAGRLLRDHDRRASPVEGEQRNTCDVLDRGGWIDDVPRACRARRRGRSSPADLPRGQADRAGRRVRADAALPRRGRRLLARAPRREGASRAAGHRHALEPVPRESDESGSGTGADTARRTIEPAFMIASLRAGDRRASSSPRRTSSASRCSCSPTTPSPRWSSPERRAIATPWDFLLAILAAVRARRHCLGAHRSDGAAALRRRRIRERARRAAPRARRSAPA